MTWKRMKIGDTRTVMVVVWRLFLGFIFALVGGFLARPDIWPSSPFPVPEYTQLMAIVLFALFGFFTPDLIGFWARIGIREFAKAIGAQIVSHLPTIQTPSVPFMTRPSGRQTIKQDKKELVNPMVIDTSVLIDGRVVEVAKTGFLFGTLLVPRFILLELQRVADSSDQLRRNRGRRGLDCLSELKKIQRLSVKLTNDQPEDPQKSVDENLLLFAKRHKAALVTNDFNLNKVAGVFGVRVLNVNDLANAVKTSVLPGEELVIKLISLGKESDQAVGYLSDGTMVVVEQGKTLIGREISVVVSRVLQTAAGRMVFAKTKNTVG